LVGFVQVPEDEKTWRLAVMGSGSNARTAQVLSVPVPPVTVALNTRAPVPAL
jgi:hypothetical protein